MSSPHSTNGRPSVEGMNRDGARIQKIIEQIEAMPNPAARTLMRECMEAVLGFYGEGIGRILETVKRSSGDGQNSYQELIHDPVVSGLLLIHGLHPLDLPTRLRAALDKVRPYMESHGGNVELLSIENDFARLRLQGSCQSCPSSAVTLELAVRHALEENCPDLAGFEVEGAAETARQAYDRAEWFELENVRTLPEGEFVGSQAGGLPLLVCRVNGRLYAYRDRCPGCNAPLHSGQLCQGVIQCVEGHVFSIVDAGRSPAHPRLHLDPLPLIEEHGAVKVALATAAPPQETEAAIA